MPQPSRPRSADLALALLPWGLVIEDYLDSIQVSLYTFCTEMTGGWLFGYADALRCAGVRPVLICFSRSVSQPKRRHEPTGMAVWLRSFVPSPPALLSSPTGSLRHWLSAFAHTVLPYVATPLRALGRVLRTERGEALLCQEYESPRFDVCTALGRWMGLPVFATFQGGTWHASRLERWTRPWALRHCAGLIVGSSLEVDRRVRNGLHRRTDLPQRR